MVLGGRAGAGYDCLWEGGQNEKVWGEEGGRSGQGKRTARDDWIPLLSPPGMPSRQRQARGCLLEGRRTLRLRGNSGYGEIGGRV